MAIDVAAELERLYETLSGDDPETVDRRLKILTALARLRPAAKKVNPEPQNQRGEVSGAIHRINGTTPTA